MASTADLQDPDTKIIIGPLSCGLKPGVGIAQQGEGGEVPALTTF